MKLSPRMNRTASRALLVVLTGALLTTGLRAAEGRRNAAPAPAPAAGAPANGKSFDAFQVIGERNIFNPNRSPRTRSVPEEKPPRVDEIALVGTLQSDRERAAFFDSTDSTFRKTIAEGEAIAGFTVRRITNEGVELSRENQTLELKVTQQLRRVEDADWTVVAGAIARSDSRSTGEIGGSAPAAEVPGDASEVLKRLMRKREKQIKP